jgi:hypothetical protein
VLLATDFGSMSQESLLGASLSSKVKSRASRRVPEFLRYLSLHIKREQALSRLRCVRGTFRVFGRSVDRWPYPLAGFVLIDAYLLAAGDQAVISTHVVKHQHRGSRPTIKEDESGSHLFEAGRRTPVRCDESCMVLRLDP